MPSISTTDAQGLSTKLLIDTYRQKIQPTLFLESFFPTVVTPTLELSIEVQRGFEKIAVDVVRGTDGNRNSFSKSSEKIFIPPYFREFMDATQLQLYDRLYGATTITDSMFSAYINNLADCMIELKNKIVRRYELQRAQVLLTGIVALNSGVSINFQRKALSIVDPGAGNYWATTTVDPYKQLEVGCNFLRQIGKATGGTFNMIMGSAAASDLFTNTKFLARQNLFNMALDQVAGPVRGAEGMTFHGVLTVGAYKLQLWQYPQFYDDAVTGVSTPYIDPKQVIIIPETPRFKMGFAAVPQLITPNTPPKIGDYVFNDYIDPRGKAHIFDVESAGVPIPVAVDQMWTFKAVA